MKTKHLKIIWGLGIVLSIGGWVPIAYWLEEKQLCNIEYLIMGISMMVSGFGGIIVTRKVPEE